MYYFLLNDLMLYFVLLLLPVNFTHLFTRNKCWYIFNHQTWKANFKKVYIYFCKKLQLSGILFSYLRLLMTTGTGYVVLLHEVGMKMVLCSVDNNLLMAYASFYLVPKKAFHNWRMYDSNSVYSLCMLMLDNKENIPDVTASKFCQKVGQQGRKNDHTFS